MRTFNSTTQRHCVEVEIFDDDTVESNETFTLSLTTNDPAVLHGGFTTVTIIDNDGMPYSFHDLLEEHHFSCLWDYVPMYLHRTMFRCICTGLRSYVFARIQVALPHYILYVATMLGPSWTIATSKP